jgi:hypothetical protein
MRIKIGQLRRLLQEGETPEAGGPVEDIVRRGYDYALTDSDSMPLLRYPVRGTIPSQVFDVFDHYLSLVGLDKGDVSITVKLELVRYDYDGGELFYNPFDASLVVPAALARRGSGALLARVLLRDSQRFSGLGDVFIMHDRDQGTLFSSRDFLALGSLDDFPRDRGADIFSWAMRSMI